MGKRMKRQAMKSGAWRQIKRWGCGAIALILTVSLSIACGNTADRPVATTESSTGTRPVEHALGIAQVPEAPERVVVLDSASLDAALALDAQLIGAALQELPEYLGDRTAGLENLGTTERPSIEQIVQLQPDLILSNQVVSEAIYPQLSDIAPTVLTAETGRDGQWPDNLKLYAEALNQTQQAERLLADYQQAVDDLKQALGNPADILVSVVASEGERSLFYSDQSFAGSILSDIGLSRPLIQTQPKISPHLDVVSKEAFETLDGDVIFLLTGISSESLSLADFVSDPLYSQLSAVQNDKVYAVSAEVWAAGRNILAAQQVLQDIANALAE